MAVNPITGLFDLDPSVSGHFSDFFERKHTCNRLAIIQFLLLGFLIVGQKFVLIKLQK